MRDRGLNWEREHTTLWSTITAIVIVVQFVWVPYRMPDGSVAWSWSWDPPMIVDDVAQEVFDEVLADADPPANARDQEIHHALQRGQHKPAPRAWTMRGLDMPAFIFIAVGVLIHFALSARSK